MSAYEARENQGTWEIVLTHTVREGLTERDARFWVAKWNEGRNPTLEELSEHHSRDWPKAEEVAS
jgi:hypothetical protein